MHLSQILILARLMNQSTNFDLIKECLAYGTKLLSAVHQYSDNVTLKVINYTGNAITPSSCLYHWRELKFIVKNVTVLGKFDVNPEGSV